MQKNALKEIYKKFQAETGYGIVIGVEQEFYFRSNIESQNQEPEELFSFELSYLNSKLSTFPFFGEVEKERGLGQFEVQISPTDDPVVIADMVMMLREIIKTQKSDDESISFAAKPYPDRPGSGLQINVNIIDSSGRNLFSKNGDEESIFLERSIAGLLELLPASMKYFVPYEEAYIRHTEGGMEAPSTVSWGPDNRTVALRIPSVPLMPYARRIEHRVPCADVDPYLAISAIVAGIEYGIVNQLENNHPKIFGNAFLPQYNLPKLPQTFAEAAKVHHEYLDMLMGSRR